MSPSLRSFFPAATTAAALAAATGGHAVTLDFEGGPGTGYVPENNKLVTDGTFASYGITFAGQSALRFEETGGGGPQPPRGAVNRVLADQQGFVCETCSPPRWDTARNGAPSSLGNYFLRLENGIGADVGRQTFDVTRPIFSLSYGFAPSGTIGGEIWDIDGRGPGASEGWRVEARRADGSIAAVVESPIITTVAGPVFDPVAAPNGTLDGWPWSFEFEAEGLDVSALEFYFTGTKRGNGIGVAFDNFRTGEPGEVPGGGPQPGPQPGPITPIPLPAGGWLLVGAIGLLGAAARRSRRRA